MTRQMDTSDTDPTPVRRESDANPTTRPRRTAIDVHSSPVAAPSSSRRRRRVDDAEMSAPMCDFFIGYFCHCLPIEWIPLLFVDTLRRRRRRRRSSTRRARPREGHADRDVFESHRDVADGVRAARRRRVHDEGVGRALVRARNQRNRGVDDREQRAHLRAVRGWVLRSTGQHHLELGVLAGEPGVRHRGWIGSRDGDGQGGVGVRGRASENLWRGIRRHRRVVRWTHRRLSLSRWVRVLREWFGDALDQGGRGGSLERVRAIRGLRRREVPVSRRVRWALRDDAGFALDVGVSLSHSAGRAVHARMSRSEQLGRFGHRRAVPGALFRVLGDDVHVHHQRHHGDVYARLPVL